MGLNVKEPLGKLCKPCMSTHKLLSPSTSSSERRDGRHTCTAFPRGREPPTVMASALVTARSAAPAVLAGALSRPPRTLGTGKELDPREGTAQNRGAWTLAYAPLWPPNISPGISPRGWTDCTENRSPWTRSTTLPRVKADDSASRAPARGTMPPCRTGHGTCYGPAPCASMVAECSESSPGRRGRTG